ncbi:hypothetical protein P7C71_g2399, partial [Lecanoromycetidae sp. Uapishka_2]
MARHEQYEYQSMPASYSSYPSSSLGSQTNNTMAGYNGYNESDFEAIPNPYVQQYQARPAPELNPRNSHTTDAYGAPMQENSPEYFDFDPLASPYLQHSQTPILSATNTRGHNLPQSNPYRPARQDRIADHGNPYDNGGRQKQPNYGRAALGLDRSNYGAAPVHNHYAPPNNTYINTQSTERGYTNVPVQSRKRRNEELDDDVLAPDQAGQKPRNKRFKSLNGLGKSTGSALGQVESTRPGRPTENDNLGNIDKVKEQNSKSKKPEGTKKRKSLEEKAGEVREENSELWWKDPETRKWVADHPDPTGGLLHNETSFKIEQKTWGEDRGHRPLWCFQWKPSATMPPPSPPKPEFMKYDGRIVLDPCDNPIKDHHNVPLTISSKMPGCKMQWMRMENPNLEQYDFWARMPRFIPESTKRNGTKPLSKPNTMINMPMMRYREKQGILSWSERDGSANIEGNLTRFFAYHDFDPVQSDNSTFDFGSDLEPWESELVKLSNLGSAPKRGGSNALDDWTRYKNNVLKMQRIESHDPELYLAVMGRPAPDLDITLDPDYNPHTAMPHVKPVPKSTGTRNRRPGRALENGQNRGGENSAKSTRRGRRPVVINLANSESEDSFEGDYNSDDDEDPAIAPGRRCSSRVRKTTRIHGEGLPQGDELDATDKDDKNDVSSDDSEYVQRPSHQHKETSALKPGAVRAKQMPDNATKRVADVQAHATPAAASQNVKSKSSQQVNTMPAKNAVQARPDVGILHAKDLQAHRKRVRELVDDKEESEYQPRAKRLRIADDGNAEEVDATEDEAEDSETQVISVNRSAPNQVIDFTKVVPKSEEEMQSLEKALQPTKDAYIELTATSAPFTDRRGSYADQWECIAKAFPFAWTMWNNAWHEDPPALPRLSPEDWSQSLTDWTYEEDSEKRDMQAEASQQESTAADPVDEAAGVTRAEETSPRLSETGEVTDDREVAPGNAFDCYSIDRILKMTRNSFQKHTKMPAPHTDRWASYADQYRHIEAAFKTWWAIENPDDKEFDRIPKLASWDAKQFIQYIWTIQEEAAEEARGAAKEKKQ